MRPLERLQDDGSNIIVKSNLRRYIALSNITTTEERKRTQSMRSVAAYIPVSMATNHPLYQSHVLRSETTQGIPKRIPKTPKNFLYFLSLMDSSPQGRLIVIRRRSARDVASERSGTLTFRCRDKILACKCPVEHQASRG